jgi:hypothetical protein
MRTLFTFVVLVSAVLVPWSSLAPVLLPDASGSAISSGVTKSLVPAARLSPALGILPLSARDELGEGDIQPVTAPTDSAANPQTLRMVCENGVCRLINDPIAAENAPTHTTVQPDSKRQKLQAIGATQIRVELDSAGEWRCACSVPVRVGSPVMRRFEATGGSDGQAIQAACRQVEAWLQDRP